MLAAVLTAMQAGKLYARVAYIAGQEARPRTKPTQEEIDDILFAYLQEHSNSEGFDAKIAVAIFIVGTTCQLHMKDYVSKYEEEALPL